jgi:cell volume regulation protein A
MESLDTVSLAILLGSLLLLAGIMSSLVALRFGAPLLFVFLVVGILAGDAGPGGIAFNDVRLTYLVGSVALALILFDGGLRTRLQIFRSVLAPSVTLATVGVLITAALTAPAAHYLLDLNWVQSLLVGAVVASTDAAAVFFLLHARGLRLRPKVSATLEVESGTNDPVAVFLTVLLIEILVLGEQSWQTVVLELAWEALLGGFIGYVGARLIVLVLNRVGLAQGLHPPFVVVAVLVVFGVAQASHASGFLAVYLAGLIVGNRRTRAHNTVEAFLNATTWLAQIVMFVMLGLLVWPERLVTSVVPALAIAAVLMLFARPAAVLICLAPFRYSLREKLFISWVGLRGAVGIFLASVPLLVGLPAAYLFFDVAFVVVLVSLLVQGWTIGIAAHRLDVAFARADPLPQRVEIDLPGQFAQELVGYPVGPNSPYMRRGLLPAWAKPTLVVREEKVLTPEEAAAVRAGDYVYLLAPPEKARGLDRFLADMPTGRRPDPRLLADFFVSGDATLGALAEIYDLKIVSDQANTTLADYFAEELDRPAKMNDILLLGPIALLAHRVEDGRVTTIGLRLGEPDAEADEVPIGERLRRLVRRAWAKLRG